MKKAFLTFVIVWGAFVTYAQDRQAIVHLLEIQQQAWNRGNVDEFMQSYWKSDSLLFVGKNGPNYGWQTTLNNYKKRYPNKAAMGKLDFTIIKVNLLDKTNAFILGGWKVTREKDSIGGYFTLWFRKFANGWKIVADHTS